LTEDGGILASTEVILGTPTSVIYLPLIMR